MAVNSQECEEIRLAGCYAVGAAAVAGEPSRHTVSNDAHVATWSEINPKVMLGKPVTRGTRITVETEDDIQAAIMYAAGALAHEQTVLVEPKA